MLMTFRTQKAMPADLQTVWAEINQADFVKHYLPEITGNKEQVQPAYVVAGKVLSWNNNRSTDIELANKDLAIDIESIELTLAKEDEQTMLTFEVEFEATMKPNLPLAQRAIKTLFHNKLAVLKQDLERNQINMNMAYA